MIAYVNNSILPQTQWAETIIRITRLIMACIWGHDRSGNRLMEEKRIYPHIIENIPPPYAASLDFPGVEMWMESCRRRGTQE